MNIKIAVSSLSLAALLITGNAFGQRRTQGRGVKRAPAKPAETASNPDKSSSDSATTSGPEEDQLKAIVALPPSERIDKLQTFIKKHPKSPLKYRAVELMVSARAEFADEKLKAGDKTGGIEQFKLAVSSAPPDMSDKLFFDVVSQIPFNVYLRGEREAALDIAHSIEEMSEGKTERILTIGNFFLRIEEPVEAIVLANAVIEKEPDNAPARLLLGAAQHMTLHFDEAVAQYAKALELDPNSLPAKSGLADLKRATGKPEEALALYKEILERATNNRQARAGVVLSLLDLDRKDEAEKELAAAMADDRSNVPLLVGTAYWYAAHGNGEMAIKLAQNAVAVEPRYTWSYIALARGLALVRKPFNSDGAIAVAKQYGNFPTLDYEMASALVQSGLYQEAAEALSHSFQIKDDLISTRLANRIPAEGTSFIKLLAPERKASIFQPAAADTDANAEVLRSLLAFYQALNPPAQGAIDEAAAVSAAKSFASGTDEMLAFRQLFAARNLVSHKVGLKAATELMEAAPDAADAAVNAPTSTMAIMADQVRSLRGQARTVGGTANVPEIPKASRSYVIRAEIEDVTGLAKYYDGDNAEAITHFKRALTVVPATGYWGRTINWHLGDALRANGNDQDALATYLKAYDANSPDALKRAMIASLYQKVNGSLDGLDAKIGPALALNSGDSAAATGGASASPTPSSEPAPATAAPSETPAITKAAEVVSGSGDTTTTNTASSTKEDAAAKPTPSSLEDPAKKDSGNSGSLGAENATPSPSPSESPATSGDSKTETAVQPVTGDDKANAGNADGEFKKATTEEPAATRSRLANGDTKDAASTPAITEPSPKPVDSRVSTADTPTSDTLRPPETKQPESTEKPKEDTSAATSEAAKTGDKAAPSEVVKPEEKTGDKTATSEAAPSDAAKSVDKPSAVDDKPAAAEDKPARSDDTKLTDTQVPASTSTSSETKQPADSAAPEADSGNKDNAKPATETTETRARKSSEAQTQKPADSSTSPADSNTPPADSTATPSPATLTRPRRVTKKKH